MRVTLPLACFLIVAVSAGCVSTAAPLRPTVADLATVKRLAVVMPGEGTFTIMAERAKGASAGGTGATIGAGAAFGLIGALAAASIGSATLNHADETQAARVRPHLVDFSARRVFVSTLMATIREGGRFESIECFEKGLEPSRARQFDAVVAVEVPEWGLHLAQSREQETLTGFVAIEVRMTLSAADRVVWHEKHMVLGQRKHQLAEYANQPELLRREVTEVWEGAARKLAFELLYPREGK